MVVFFLPFSDGILSRVDFPGQHVFVSQFLTQNLFLATHQVFFFLSEGAFLAGESVDLPVQHINFVFIFCDFVPSPLQILFGVSQSVGQSFTLLHVLGNGLLVVDFDLPEQLFLLGEVCDGGFMSFDD